MNPQVKTIDSLRPCQHEIQKSRKKIKLQATLHNGTDGYVGLCMYVSAELKRGEKGIMIQKQVYQQHNICGYLRFGRMNGSTGFFLRIGGLSSFFGAMGRPAVSYTPSLV